MRSITPWQSDKRSQDVGREKIIDNQVEANFLLRELSFHFVLNPIWLLKIFIKQRHWMGNSGRRPAIKVEGYEMPNFQIEKAIRLGG